MLRLFETFLESAPQLVLQIYILTEQRRGSPLQYASIMTSFCSISWAAVDYQRLLRKSLPHKKKLVCGLPVTTYLLYKLLTLTSWTLSIALLTAVNIYAAAILMGLSWIIGIIWASKQNTTFCTAKCMEFFYRTVVGIILLFTFFNVKGEKTKISVSLYYAVRVLQTIAILTLCWNWKPSITETAYFMPISISVVLGLGLGLICLVLYYGFCHPHTPDAEERISDEVDGQKREKVHRIRNFIQH
ncbi:XK-related protein 9 [Latimeria chalumnae]|uniref:XK-related protein 9 n=1 Tax=Latimeria chalumnae TaxID=7897 RepID=UPI00313D31D8